MVDVIFNIRSPFCALIVDRVFDLERQFPVSLNWVIIADIPRVGGGGITRDSPKFAYNRQDCKRRADWAGLKWSPPDWRLTDVDWVSRAAIWIQRNRPQLFEAFCTTLSRSYWSHGQNISDPDIARAITRDLGISVEEVSTLEKREAELSAQLSANFAWCRENAVFGAPFFRFKDHAFWGGDRLSDLERVISETLSVEMETN